VNFATIGVIIGFAALGLFLSVLDIAASQRLAAHNVQSFVLWFLPGISLLQVGGSLVEVTSSAAASVVVAVLVNRYLTRLQRKPVVRQSRPPFSARRFNQGRVFRMGGH
jgi:hypothetical protein